MRLYGASCYDKYIHHPAQEWEFYVAIYWGNDRTNSLATGGAPLQTSRLVQPSFANVNLMNAKLWGNVYLIMNG